VGVEKINRRNERRDGDERRLPLGKFCGKGGGILRFFVKKDSGQVSKEKKEKTKRWVASHIRLTWIKGGNVPLEQVILERGRKSRQGLGRKKKNIAGSEDEGSVGVPER